MDVNFPPFYKAIVKKDDVQKWKNYAIIQDGKIVATNGSVIICSDFANFDSLYEKTIK